MCHNGFTYKEGLNVDTLPFNPSGSCEPGGLYYTSLDHLEKWRHDERWPLIADVTIPADARVHTEPCGTKWKADKLVLSNIRSAREFMAARNEAEICSMLTNHPWMLKHVSDPTEAMCIAAVKGDPHVLGIITNQTEAMCLAAVRLDGYALQFVQHQTEAICLAAVQNFGFVLTFVHQQTEALCRAALERTPEARGCVKIPIDF
jgi:hypothetical protein